MEFNRDYLKRLMRAETLELGSIDKINALNEDYSYMKQLARRLLENINDKRIKRRLSHLVSKLELEAI